MKTEVIPRLFDTVMQTRQAHPQIEVLHQGILYSLEVTFLFFINKKQIL